MADNGSVNDDTTNQNSEIIKTESAPIDELSREIQETLSVSQRHKFWETQPVGQFKDLRDTSLPEGPIEPPTPLSEVKQEPYNLPNLYEWVTCDMNSEETCLEVYNLLSNNYVEDDENMFRFNYSKEFLQWALHPPGYFKTWHIGVRVKSSKKLVAFITGIPAKIRVQNEIITMAEVNFLCVHKKLRSKRLAPVMIKEVTRRVHLENIWQAAYTAGVVLPTPITSCQYWHRSLNPKKLIDVGFSRLGPRMTMSRTMKLYKLPDSPLTPGFRKMELRDVPSVTRLLKTYLLEFVVAPDFDEMDVEHWIVPKEGVVDSFVVESQETHEVTDFCSFYSLPSSILGHPNHSNLKAAYSYYNVATKTPLIQLMNDALIVAKQMDFDVFNALDVMHNEGLFLSPFNLVFQKSIDKKEKMTPLLFTLLALEMGLIIILLFHSPIRNLVVTGLDRLKQGRGLVASRTLTTILSVVFVFNLYGIYKNQKHMMEVGVTNPTDRVLLSNHILEASLMGFCLFLGLMIDRLHYYVKELWLLRKSLKAIRNQIGDSDLIQPINKNKKI